MVLFLYAKTSFCQTYSICIKGKVARVIFGSSFGSSNFEDIKNISKDDSISAVIKYTIDNKVYTNKDSTLYRFTTPLMNEFKILIREFEFTSSPTPIIDLTFYKAIPSSQDNRGQSDFYFNSDKNEYPTLKKAKWGLTTMQFHIVDSLNEISNRVLPINMNVEKVFSFLQFMGESSVPPSPDKQVFYITANCYEVKFDCINTPTSAEIESSPQSFTLTPNPSATGLFHIDGEPTNIQVYNAQGNEIVPSFINPNTLDLSAFPKGMYVVVATVNGAIMSKKVVRE